ncbi:MAG: DUF4175 family protein, partial [Dongiaceae bacterium]
RVGVPRAGLARRDPLGLRAALGLLLIIAAVAAGDDGPARLARAAQPDLAGFGPAAPARLDLWVTPPAYTGVAPIFLTAGAAPAAPAPSLTVPMGSRVLAQVLGGRGRPDLRIGETVVAFNAIDEGSYRAEGEIRAGDELRVEQRGRLLASWPLRVLPDAVPAIDFAGPPQRTERAALRLEYDATDDYGLAAVRAVIRRPDGLPPADGTTATIELALPLPGANLKAARAAGFHDLTPHPWAGVAVELRLEALDALGQIGTSEPFAMTLPERIFNHPVARAIVEQRKQLTLAPEARVEVRRALAAIAAQPQAYGDDLVVALALRAAERRLFHDRTNEAIGSVQSLLWDTALRLEEGDLAIFERELRAAQEALQEALAGDATDEEIERLMDQLQVALDRFLSALAEQLQRDGQDLADAAPPDPNATALQREDLQRLLDQARELARTGAREAARNLLAQLQEMLENLQAGRPGQPQEGTAEAMRLMRDLDALTQRQQDLLDRSFRQSQQMRPGDRAPNAGDAARDQEGLRRALGETMRRFGELMDDIPRPLGRAELAMRDAVEALRQGAPDAAVGPQTRALNELQQGARAMIESLMEQFGPQPGVGQERFGESRDPLGRLDPGMGMIDTGDVAIPEEADLQRAREILDELRRRAGERARPQLELDYIDRLLRRF